MGNDGRDVSAMKIGAPEPVRGAVIRARLLGLLDAQPHLIVVRAPAGYGKTTLVAQWAAARRARGEAVAWVTVDQFDDSVHSIWSAILAAIETAVATPVTALTGLTAPREEPQAGFFHVLEQAIAAVATPITLVIDDLHAVSSPAVLNSLDYFVQHLPPRLRCVLISRVSPSLATERLGLSGSFLPIGASALRFEMEETAALLELHGVALASADLRAVVELTEGWAAGIRFAASAIAASGGQPGAIGQMRAEDQSMTAYLAQEVFDRHPLDIQEFLMATSICDNVGVELAGLLSGRQDAGIVLAGLEQDNTLIIRIDSEPVCYRYHALLRDFLRRRLRVRQPTRWRALNAAAAAWFEEQGDALAALAHAVEARDAQAAQRIMRRDALALVASGEGPALRRIIAGAPAEWRVMPDIGLGAVAAHLDAGDTSSADALLSKVHGDTAADGRLVALDATLRLHRARLGGDIATALDRVCATSAGRTGDDYLDQQALIHIGVARMYLGLHEHALDPIERGLQLALERGDDYVTVQCLIQLSVLAAIQSDLNAMRDYGRRALIVGEAHGWHMTSLCSFGHVALGWPAYLALEDESAAAESQAAIDSLTARSDPTVQGSAEALQAVVTFGSAEDPAAVLEGLRAMWEAFSGEVLAPALFAYASPYEARMCFEIGHEEWARDVIERLVGRFGETGETRLVRAMISMDQHDYPAAGTFIHQIISAPASCSVHNTLVEAWVLEAERRLALGDERARDAVSRALVAARPQHIYRPIAIASVPVRALAAQVVSESAEWSNTSLRRALTGARREDIHLTARERELLRQLRWRREAVVEHTINEIAEALFISPNTAKTHLRSLYRKLGVANRAEAVAAAERRGLE